ncbi:MAG: right-handed parallel beta-helix repeat-containing protein, partial [Kangiellaceae bacterium]|nr:right-handed parallel beta-helix repeat-containing protein [Kangiellaceae bacterium]
MGSTGDFTSFTDLSIRLTNCGISGPVTVNVQPGTYQDRLTLGAITGSSAINTITINGGAIGLVTLTNGALATVDLEGTDYLTIKNMTIENTGTLDAYGIRFSNNADHNTIDSNRFICNTASTGSDITPIVASASPTSNATEGQNAFYNTISNNHIIGGYYGVRFEGQFGTTNRNRGNEFLNNTLSDQYYYGFLIDEQDSMVISGNTIENLGRGTNAFADGFDLDDMNNYIITGNYVEAPDVAFMLDDGNFDGTPASRGLIANNIFIAPNDYGMDIDDIEQTDIWHNTVVNGSASTGAFY